MNFDDENGKNDRVAAHLTQLRNAFLKKSSLEFAPYPLEQLTFFSDSRYLLIAGTDEPVRSLRATIASLISVKVVIVSIILDLLLLFVFYSLKKK